MITVPPFSGQLLSPAVAHEAPLLNKILLPEVAYWVMVDKSLVEICRAPAGAPMKELSPAGFTQTVRFPAKTVVGFVTVMVALKVVVVPFSSFF